MGDAPISDDNGYCVFALNYGSYAGDGSVGIDATGPIETSAAQLATFVQKVLAATGASQVDIVGHSRGGMMPRYYLKFLGGAPYVHTLIGLAPSNHGTTLDGLFTLAGDIPGADAFLADCPACQEQAAGSPFMTKLNAGGDTVPGVDYTVIESQNDEVVTPYQSAFLSGPNVTNIDLQQQCSLDQGEHWSMAYDHIADADVLTALDPAHPVPGGAGARRLNTAPEPERYPGGAGGSARPGAFTNAGERGWIPEPTANIMPRRASAGPDEGGAFSGSGNSAPRGRACTRRTSARPVLGRRRRGRGAVDRRVLGAGLLGRRKDGGFGVQARAELDAAVGAGIRKVGDAVRPHALGELEGRAAVGRHAGGRARPRGDAAGGQADRAGRGQRDRPREATADRFRRAMHGQVVGHPG